jgi:hypothetical protein
MIDAVALWITAVVVAFLVCSPAAQAGFASAEPRSSVVVITASSHNEAVRDCADAACTNGPVARAIAAALKDPNITIVGLFDEVTAKVAAATDRSQLPSITASEPIGVPLRKPTGKSVGLVIGNGAYTHFPRLRGAPHDADTVGGALREIGFETKILIDSPFDVLDKEIDGLVQGLGADDTAVLYYSGHGFWLNGANYLPTLETELPSNDGTALGSFINVSALLDTLARSKAGKTILILDTHFPEIRSSIAR